MAWDGYIGDDEFKTYADGLEKIYAGIDSRKNIRMLTGKVKQYCENKNQIKREAALVHINASVSSTYENAMSGIDGSVDLFCSGSLGIRTSEKKLHSIDESKIVNQALERCIIDPCPASYERFAIDVCESIKLECLGRHNERMEENVKRSRLGGKVRYAFIPTSRKVCGYCCMHASNGFAYERIFSKKLHERCRCIAVPGIEGKTSVGGHDPMVYYKGYSLLAKRDDRGFIIRNDDGVPLFKSGKTFDTVEMSVVDKPERFMSNAALGKRRESKQVYEQWVERVKKGPLTINGDQKKHHIDSQEYAKAEIARNQSPSVVCLTLDEEYRIVRECSGYGYPLKGENGEWTKKEVCICDSTIGYIESRSGIIKTTAFTIHYGEKGCHIVPKYDGSVLR
ncbi:MAG: polymorphic toxin type 50 domain-containing protein [Eggerthellaceae bacterium]